MTNEEAIVLIKGHKCFALGHPGGAEAFDMAVDALEKQYPEQEAEHFIEINGYFCCRKTEKAIRYPLVSFKDLLYCPQCGQKID